MKRLITTGLVAVAATALSAAPAQAEGLTLVDSPSTGSTEVVPDCWNGPMVLFNGTGSAAIDLGADLGAMVVLALIGGEANTGSGQDGAVDGPCADTAERNAMTKLLTYLNSGSAHI